MESDPAQPRFVEMKDALLADVMGASGESSGREGTGPAPGSGEGWWFRLDRAREAFRDDLMERWLRIRRGALAAAVPHVAAGHLASAEDVFLLDDEALDDPGSWDVLVHRVRARREEEILVQLPFTARLDEIEAALDGTRGPRAGTDGQGLRGIGIGGRSVQGRVVRASDLPDLLAQVERGARPALDRTTVLLVPALEPSWGILFGRVGAVVTEIGGELSHASILLREAGCVAAVNCAGAAAVLCDGDLVEVNGSTGTVRRVPPAP